MLSVAVFRGRTGLGRIGDQGIGAGRLRLAETGGNDPVLAIPAHDARKRIVAAGIEHDQPQLAGAVGRRHHAIERDRLVLGVAIAGQPGIDRDQVIRAADLEAVTGIKDHGDIGLIGIDLEFSNRPFQFDIGGVDDDVDIIEAGIAKHLPDRDRIPLRVR